MILDRDLGLFRTMMIAIKRVSTTGFLKRFVVLSQGAQCLKTTKSKAMDSEPLPYVSHFKESSDVYRGVSVDTSQLTFSEEEFETNLCSALLEWPKNGVRGVWFRVSLNEAYCIPILVKNGFTFHHARKTYAMLTKWLLESEPDSLPQFPHTHVGIGGLVVNDKNEVLVIKEKYHHRPRWKLPGGYSTQGEEFADTAKREVLEETGINTQFVSVVSLRHHHQHIFNCSDIYVVCHMRPLSSEITVGATEISECQWMDIEVYRNHPDVTEFNKFVVNAFLESQHLKAAVVATSVISYYKDRYVNVYSVKQLDEKSEN